MMMKAFLALLLPALVVGLGASLASFGRKQGREVLLVDTHPDQEDGSNAPSGKRAVIGLAAGRSYGLHSKAFVKSLRKTGYDGDIILGVDASTARELGSFYKENGVTAAVLKDAHKCHTEGMGDNCANIQVGEHTGEAPINLARFSLYKKWTVDLDDDTLIMVSDVKDVIFQRDPFPRVAKYIAQGKDFFAFEEIKHNTLAWDIQGHWVRVLLRHFNQFLPFVVGRILIEAGSWHVGA
jgi:hypothetical protein